MARRCEYHFRVVKTIFYERAQRMNKILFSTRVVFSNIDIFKLPCNVLYIIWSEVGTSRHRTYINSAGKHTRFLRVTYFFIFSLVKI